MPVREGGSYIADPKTGALQPNLPPAPEIPPAEAQPTPSGQPAGGVEAPAEDAPAADLVAPETPAAGRRKKG